VFVAAGRGVIETLRLVFAIGVAEAFGLLVVIETEEAWDVVGAGQDILAGVNAILWAARDKLGGVGDGSDEAGREEEDGEIGKLSHCEGFELVC
jgi:hypothetical protein